MTRTIWLASYPKSGNTWFRMLVANLSAEEQTSRHQQFTGTRRHRQRPRPVRLSDADRLRAARRMTRSTACARASTRNWRRARATTNTIGTDDASPVRFVKVHDAYTLTPKGEPLLAGRRGADGAIFIVRDPRDVAPSIANHNRTNIDAAIALMNDRDAVYCAKPGRMDTQLRQQVPGWSGHIASWLDQRDLPVHLIRYEDLQADTFATFRAALSFAGRPADDDDIWRAVGLRRF